MALKSDCPFCCPAVGQDFVRINSENISIDLFQIQVVQAFDMSHKVYVITLLEILIFDKL
ncbi:MAG TPA: hypothetical protein EYG89_04420 [Bacteroidia bacterium]|nr:hypothetical protein [Bacteroidia bacterium]